MAACFDVSIGHSILQARHSWRQLDRQPHACINLYHKWREYALIGQTKITRTQFSGAATVVNLGLAKVRARRKTIYTNPLFVASWDELLMSVIKD